MNDTEACYMKYFSKLMTQLDSLYDAEINPAANLLRGRNDAQVQDLLKKIGYLKRLIDFYNKKNKIATLENVIELANHMDELGFYKIANKIDEHVGYGFFPKENKQVVEEEEIIQYPEEGSLSTRYCPDHIGVQTSRISERVYQCPMDGMIYNYESGYKNYQGQIVPGGSVAAQTPTSSNYGGIPMRIYDSRQSILNRVN